VLQELDRITIDMEDISSQHDISKGNVPPGVTAATAISFLQEKDDSLLSHTYQSIEFGFEKLARQSISHVVEFWDMERTVQTTGVDGSFDALTLKGADIASGTDIRMEAGSALPTSKAARQALLMDLMKFGYIKPEDGLKMMEVGGITKLYQQLKVDEAQAQRENLRIRNITPEQIQEHQQRYAENPETDPTTGDTLAAGPVVQVNTWDNHAIHIEVHNRFRKSQAFEALPPEIKAEFEQHVSTHAQAMVMGSMGAGPDMGMAPTAEDLGLPSPDDPNAQDASGGNQFGPPGSSGGQMPPDMPMPEGGGEAPLPGLEQM
jgi:hypothetical protein